MGGVQLSSLDNCEPSTTCQREVEVGRVLLECQRHRGPGLRDSGMPGRGEGRGGWWRPVGVSILSRSVVVVVVVEEVHASGRGGGPFDAVAPAEGMRMRGMKQGEECGRREDKRTSRNGREELGLDGLWVGSSCCRGDSWVWPTAALPARRPAVLASLTWFGRGQASDHDGREETPKPCCGQRGEKLTANLGARRGQRDRERERELCWWHEATRAYVLSLRGHR